MIPMKGLVAAWYARNTLPDMEEYRCLARKVAAHLRPGAQILEVAPGPGYLAIELARPGSFRVTGMDISSTFVEMAARNARDAAVAVDFIRGDAASIPVEDGKFDFLVCRAAFRSFMQPLCALLEMHRVLKRRGTALIVDLKPDVRPEAVDDFNRRARRTGLSALFTKWTLLHLLAQNAHSREELAAMIRGTGFSRR
ncbi:MAG TPA: class I SAM-dependent methyltransferase, partial [Spirochaetia bacterium]|nr:class I SAM-dependent methyltransferase [Spirochaetia bacterium]